MSVINDLEQHVLNFNIQDTNNNNMDAYRPHSSNDTSGRLNTLDTSSLCTSGNIKKHFQSNVESNTTSGNQDIIKKNNDIRSFRMFKHKTNNITAYKQEWRSVVDSIRKPYSRNLGQLYGLDNNTKQCSSGFTKCKLNTYMEYYLPYTHVFHTSCKQCLDNMVILSNIYSNIKNNTIIDHKLNKNMEKDNKVKVDKKTSSSNMEYLPITCYQYTPSRIITNENESESDSFPLDEQETTISGTHSNNTNEETFFIEKMFLEFRRNNSINNNNSHFLGQENGLLNERELEMKDKIEEMKKIIKIKNCFFVFRNLQPILYNCIQCETFGCPHKLDKIDLPCNRILLKDITTFLEMMDYPFTTNRHHRETKEFLKDELKISEYTNKYCSNIWLSSYFFTKILPNRKFDMDKFIEKEFFQRYDLTSYLEKMFGINIVSE